MTESGAIRSDQIDLRYRPRPEPAIVSESVGNEMVLVNTDTGFVHALNPLATLVWQCFDGDASLEEIVADLADVFETPAPVVSGDVIAMTRAAGEVGLLEGIDRAAGSKTSEESGRLHGAILRLPGRSGDGRGARTLLIHWSADCGFCVGILPQLAALAPALDQTGTEMVLVDDATPDATRLLIGEHGLTANVVEVRPTTAFGIDPFAGTGTPVAYLLDDDGRVASGLAYGADPVLALARSALAAPPEGPAGPTVEVPDFLPVAGGVCGPGARKPSGRPLGRTVAYGVGSFRIGIRANSRWAEEVVAGALAHYRLPDSATAPANFSVVLSEDAASTGRRELNILLAGTPTVARSRSPRRVITALAGHLSCLLEPESGVGRLDAIGAVVDGKAVLLPKSVMTWHLGRLQAPLARMGVQLVDEPFAHVDLHSSELVVTGPRLRLQEQVLAGLPDPVTSMSEPSPVRPGRYPLGAWLIPSATPTSPAAAVSAALSLLVAEADEVAASIGLFSSLLAGIEAVTVMPDDPLSVMRSLQGLVVADRDS